MQNRKSNRKLSLGDTRFWIGILIVLLIVLNGVVFFVYQQSHLEEGLATQIWEYLKSDPFKYVTISIVLPIILFFLERLFDIKKTRQARLEEIAKTREERKEKEKQAGIAERWKCVDQTVKLWYTLRTTVNELALFKADSPEISKREKQPQEQEKKQSVRDLYKAIMRADTEWTELVNAWDFWFPNLRPSDVKNPNLLFTDNLVYFLNILLYCSETVACCIEKGNDAENNKELQNSLLAISDGVENLVYQPMLKILKYSIEVWKDGQEADTAHAEINKMLQILIGFADQIRMEEWEYNDFLPTLEDDVLGKKLRVAHKAVRDLCKPELDFFKTDDYEGLVDYVMKSQAWTDFKALLKEVKDRDLMQAQKIYYSPEFVKHLAKWFVRFSTLDQLLECAGWRTRRKQA